MGEHVVDAYELQSPVEGVEDIRFLGHELIVIVRDPDKIEQLVYAWVGLFKVFGRNEHAG